MFSLFTTILACEQIRRCEKLAKLAAAAACVRSLCRDKEMKKSFPLEI